MRRGRRWHGRWWGALAALVLLSHCGRAPEEPSDSSGEREEQPGPGEPQPGPGEPQPGPGEPQPGPMDCMPRSEGASSYCTYRGTGGGLIAWTRHYGGLGPERLQAMASGAEGDFVAAGQFGDAPFPGGTGFALARYAADGTPLWDRQVTAGDARVTALAVTPLGNLLAVGTYRGMVDLGTGPLPVAPGGSFPNQSLFLAKFAPDGRLVWAHGFVATFTRDGQVEQWPIYPRAVATDAQGSLLVTGNFHGTMDLGGGPLFAGEASVSPRFESYSGGFLAKFSWSGEHLWSRVFKSNLTTSVPVTSSSVATTPAGHVLVGGFAGRESDLGDGLLGERGPFLARYDGSGALLWKRLFPDLIGEVASVRPLGEDAVAFLGDFAGSFTFGGHSYTAGDLSAPTGAYDTRPFMGTLSTTGGDGWLRMLGEGNAVWELTTDGADSLTVTGSGQALDLGGGVLGPDSPRPFVVRYGSDGAHRWSRVFDENFEVHSLLGWGSIKRPVFFLVPQPGGPVVLGSDFTSPVQVDGSTYTSRGSSDLLYLRLAP